MPIPPVPTLPNVTTKLTNTWTKQWRAECGTAYFLACLEYAQSLWIQGLPAQAILQINKSFMATIPDDQVSQLPHASLDYILRHALPTSFLGNPVRHFQHLATRIPTNAPLAELRVWRAWSCFHIAQTILNDQDYPIDTKQLRTKHLVIPSKQEVESNIHKLGLPHEWKTIAPYL